MTTAKLFIYNYGTTKVADFGKNFHDAFQCMKAMNDQLIKSHGFLPEKIFYFVEYKKPKHLHKFYHVDCTNGLSLAETDKRINRVSVSMDLVQVN